jgi:hypothetical protein
MADMQYIGNIFELAEQDYPKILSVVLQKVRALRTQEERSAWLEISSMLSERYQTILESKASLNKENIHCVEMMGEIKAECIRNITG